MVGLWYYNQSGVTELLIIRDPHYGRMCFESVETLEALHQNPQLKPSELYIPSCGKGPRPFPQLRM